MIKLNPTYTVISIFLSISLFVGLFAYTALNRNESSNNPEVLGITGDQYKCTKSVNCPSDVLDLTNWKITLPIGSNESPIEVKPTDKSPQIPIKEFKHDEYFHLNADKSGVVFKAHAGGVTTSGSGYPRSELRERVNNGAEDANWTSSSGKHAMYIEQAVLNLPVKKPHVVVGQIHAKKKGSSRNDDIVVFRLEGKKLYINADGTSNDVVLTENYELGTKFSVGLEVQNNKIKFYYNGSLVNHVMDSEFTNSYFKAGMYTQSNCRDNGEFPEDACDAYGESVIYKLKVCKDQSTICGMENDTPPPPPTDNKAPVSVIKTSTVSGNAPLTVNFDGTDSSDPEGGILTYVWDFGDGSTSTNSKPSYKYNSSGTYTVNLTVKDNKDATNTSTKAITVTSSTSTNQPPVAVITAQPTSGQAPLTVSLSAARSTDSDGSIVSYQWDLDDNSNPTGIAISHVYSKSRTYKVKLTVKDNKGASSSVTQNITVEASTLGTANSVIGVYKSASQTLKFTFDGSNSTSSTGSVSSYKWNFGDGKTSSSKKLDYTYSKAGTYKIMLTVTNSSGAKSTTYMTIVVGE
jgi:PKD repeat protein